MFYFFKLVIRGRYWVYCNNAGSNKNYLNLPSGTAFKVHFMYYPQWEQMFMF